jgi:hypothetical protein
MEKTTEQLKARSFYTIITGFFEFNPAFLHWDNLKKEFDIWTSRIKKDDLQSFVSHLNSNYYDNYLSICYPAGTELKTTDTRHLIHLTKRDLIDKTLEFSVNTGNEWVRGHIEWIDLYLFPGGIGIFSAKLGIREPQDLNLSLIAGFIKSIKSPATEIEMNGQKTTMNDFFEKQVLGNLKLEKPLTYYTPGYKTYTIIDFPEQSIQESETDKILYEIGTSSDIGTASGTGLFAPSESYFRKLIQNNKLSVFNNWSALCLFDSFTRIGFGLPDSHKVWEFEYFNIYVVNLYQKAYLYKINSELSDLTTLSKRTESLRNSFVTFVNEFRFNYISYKFLPNLIYEKINSVLEISQEIDHLELKIQKINELAQKKRSTAIGRALNIIVILGFFTVMNNFSSWLEKSGVPSKLLYPYFSLVSLFLFAIVLYIFLFAFKRK